MKLVNYRWQTQVKHLHKIISNKSMSRGDLREYRKISLVGCVYKKKVLPSIISPFQGACVQNKQILDRVVIVNELIHAQKQSKKAGVIFKIDMEKAYNCGMGLCGLHVEEAWLWKK